MGGLVFPLDWRHAVTGAVFGIVLPLAYLLVHMMFTDVSHYYTLRSLQGPYTAVIVKGQNRLGVPATEFHDGETIAYLVNDCLSKAVKAEAFNDIVDLSDNYVVSVVADDVLDESPTRECVTHSVFRVLPLDLAPGFYQIKRQITVFPVNWAPSTAISPGLNFKIVK